MKFLSQLDKSPTCWDTLYLTKNFIFLPGYEDNEDDISNFDEDLDYILDDPLDKRSGGWKLRAGKRGSWKLRAGKRDPLLALKRNWKLRAGKRSYNPDDDEDQIDAQLPPMEDLNTFFKRKFWKLRSMKRAGNDWKFRSGKREAMWKLRAGKRSMEDV